MNTEKIDNKDGETVDEQTGEVIKNTTETALLVTKENDQALSIFTAMAAKYGMDKRAFESTVFKTLMPQTATREQVASFLIVAKQYDLNPFTKEIYAFPAKGGGIQPVVSVDGWYNLMNSHPQHDGIEFKDQFNESGHLISVTCLIHRKDRNNPTVVTEYMIECARNTDPWKQWPMRMLRHKAAIQCARVAYGFAGIIEPDEYERVFDAPKVENVTVLSQKLKDRGETLIA